MRHVAVSMVVLLACDPGGAATELPIDVPSEAVATEGDERRGAYALTLTLDGVFAPGGDPGTVTVTGAGAGDTVRVVRGQAGISCPAVLGGDCLSLTDASVQLTGSADASGTRAFGLAIPASVPDGSQLCLQAIAGDGAPFDFSTAGCTVVGSPSPAECKFGGVEVSTAPAGNMMVCNDPANATCEENFEWLCPLNWHLCTVEEFNNRNDGWTQAASTTARALGVILCRDGGVGAGHFTVPDAFSSIATLGEDEVHNCFYGSSAFACPTDYGCNEITADALCCAPQPLCGNGIVDHAEEQCDDGNTDDSDDCLSSCAWRIPTDHGLDGTNCVW